MLVIAVFYNTLIYVSFMFLTVYLLFKIKPIKDTVMTSCQSAPEWAARIGVIIVFSIANMLVSKFSFEANGALVNIRTGITLVGTVLFGIIPGFAISISGGLFRYSLGDWSALPCCVAAIAAPIAPAIFIYFFKKKNAEFTFIIISILSLIAVFWEVIHLLVLLPT